MSEVEVFFTEKAGISGKLRKAESGEEATGNDGTEVWRLEILKGRHIHCLVDNGKHGIFGPISQDVDEIFVDFHRLLTEEPRIHAASSSQTMRRAGCQTTNKPHADHQKPSSG